MTGPAMLLAPLLALLHLSVAYALTLPSCELQRPALLHLASGAFFVLALLLTWSSARGWRQARAEAEDARGGRRRFAAMVATGIAALSSLVILALWIPPWLLSPCQV